MRHNVLDFYALRHLQACGLRGQPFSNFVHVSPIRTDLLLETMEKLQAAGLMVVKGKKSLADAAHIIRSGGPYNIPIYESEDGFTVVNRSIFTDFEFFSHTQARVTLKGHWFLSQNKDSDPSLRDVIEYQHSLCAERALKAGVAIPSALKPL